MMLPFTDLARKALSDGRAYAAELCLPKMGSQHLLVGLMSSEVSTAAKALARSGLGSGRLAEVRTYVAGMSAPSDPRRPTRDPAASEELIDLIVEVHMVTESLGSPYVDTEHLLLALIHHESAAGRQVLAHFGVDLTKVAAEIDRLLVGYQRSAAGR